jgi:hypothetical protein
LGTRELQLDNVETTMDTIQELFQDQRDIEKAMQIPISDQDIEKELDMLVEMERVDQITSELDQLHVDFTVSNLPEQTVITNSKIVEKSLQLA